MKYKWFLIVTILFTTLLLTGCSEKSDINSPANTLSLSISPANMTKDVPVDTKIILTFTQSVNPQTVEDNIHLISLSAAMDTNCIYGEPYNHGGMTQIMGDSVKLSHLDQKHSTLGVFKWSNNNTICTFTPDSLLTSKMTYMIHVGKKIMEMMDGNMQGMEGMDMGKDMISHFVTKDLGKRVKATNQLNFRFCKSITVIRNRGICLLSQDLNSICNILMSR